MKTPHPHQVPKAKMIDPLASYTSNCKFNMKFCNRPSALRKPLAQNRWKWKIWNFVIFACNIPWPSLWLGFPKNNTKIASFYRHLEDKLYLLFSTFFSKKWHFQVILIFPFLTSKSWYLSYAIYIINVFHSVNLALNLVTSTDSIQKSVNI